MVTVHDIARATGVSISTVSRALSVPEKVAPATRERVQAAALELGYTPNRAASGLRAGKTSTFGLLVPDLSNPYFAAVTKGVAERAHELGLGVFVVDSEETPGLEADLVRGLAVQTDGVILASPRALVADAEQFGPKPVVLINQVLDHLHCLGSDNAGGMRLAVEHLVELGHTKIAYIAGPETSWSNAVRQRELAAVRGANPGLDIVELGPYAPVVESGHAAAGAVIAAGATAVIAFNDFVAVGFLRRAQGLGLRVPRDISVVSFDDTYLAGLVTPSLTSVSTDLRELGRRATDLLAGEIKTPKGGVSDLDAEPVALGDDGVELLPVSLVVRESTAPEPSRLPTGD